MSDDFPVTFGAKSDEEKIADFQRSTLDKFLRGLGWTKEAVIQARRDYGEAGWGFDWFNQQGILPFSVTATRVFNFDLAMAFDAPTKSALLAAYREQRDLFPAEDEFAMIFKVHGMPSTLFVATSKDLSAVTHIHVSVFNQIVSIATMKDFLSTVRDPNEQ
jgi:hypothetical protein